MSKVEIGQLWRTTPRHKAWKIERELDVLGKPGVELSRGPIRKTIQQLHLRSGYILVGGEREARCIADWKRNKWLLAEDIANG